MSIRQCVFGLIKLSFYQQWNVFSVGLTDLSSEFNLHWAENLSNLWNMPKKVFVKNLFYIAPSIFSLTLPEGLLILHLNCWNWLSSQFHEQNCVILFVASNPPPLLVTTHWEDPPPHIRNNYVISLTLDVFVYAAFCFNSSLPKSNCCSEANFYKDGQKRQELKDGEHTDCAQRNLSTKSCSDLTGTDLWPK